MANKALPIVAGGAAALILTSKKRKNKKSKRSRWGVAVSNNCQTVTVVKPDLFNNFLYGAYEELISVDPTLTLIQVSDALFGEVAPDCSGFPEEPESPEIAELYAVIAQAIASFMARDPRTKDSIGTLIDEATRIYFVDWYRYWINYPSPNIPDAPSGQVVFSTDYSQYKIGENWYNDVIIPFVEEASSQGRLDTVLSDFINNIGVQVGQFTVPVSDLPQEKESVQDFLLKLDKALNKAESEV